MIFKLPGRSAAGKIIEAQVRTTDILPTVLDLVGAPQKAQFDGESLKADFTGEAKSRVAFGETDYPLRFGWASLRSVRTEGFKFIEAPRPEFYDLGTDPGELKNTYSEENADAQKLQELLASLRPKKGPPASDDQSAEANSAVGASSSQLPDPKDKIEEQNFLHRAMIATEGDQPADARQALEKVLEMDPKSSVALRQLGELEMHAGNFAQSALHLKTASQIRPDDATIAYELGQALAKASDLAGARDALETSLKLAPGQTAARILLGNVYLSLKNLSAAEDQFEAALLSEPNNAEAKVGLAKVKALKR